MFSWRSPGDSNVQPGLRTADVRTHPRPDRSDDSHGPLALTDP